MKPREHYPFMAPGDQLYTIDYEMEGEPYPWYLVFPVRNVEEAQVRFAAIKATGRLRLDTIEEIYPCDKGGTGRSHDGAV